MGIPEDLKDWIDSASYESLLSRWRNASVPSPYFIGETGQYYQEVMARKREAVGPDEHVRASKSIGLDGPN